MPNPVVYSGFLSKNLQAWLDDVDLPQEARMMIQSMGQTTTRHNVLYYDSWEATLTDPNIKTYSTLSGDRTSQRVVIGKIIGDGYIQISGKDYDGVTGISADLRGIGTEKMPAIVIWMGYNIDEIKLVPLETCTFHVKHLVICEDGDPLYS